MNALQAQEILRKDKKGEFVPKLTRYMAEYEIVRAVASGEYSVVITDDLKNEEVEQ